MIRFSLVSVTRRWSSARELGIELFYGVRVVQKIEKSRNQGFEKREWKKNILRVEER